MSLRIQVSQNDEVVVDEVGGGGNPNYVETILGTVANPWGQYSFEQIKNMCSSNNYTLKFNYSGTRETCCLLVNGFGIVATTEILLSPDATIPDDLGGYMIEWRKAGLFYAVRNLEFYPEKEGTIIPDSTATTLAIIHHPLPES